MEQQLGLAKGGSAWVFVTLDLEFNPNHRMETPARVRDELQNPEGSTLGSVSPVLPPHTDHAGCPHPQPCRPPRRLRARGESRECLLHSVMCVTKERRTQETAFRVPKGQFPPAQQRSEPAPRPPGQGGRLGGLAAGCKPSTCRHLGRAHGSFSQGRHIWACLPGRHLCPVRELQEAWSLSPQPNAAGPRLRGGSSVWLAVAQVPAPLQPSGMHAPHSTSPIYALPPPPPPTLFLSHSASLLDSAWTSALPKTTTKESRSLVAPGWSWALVTAESGVRPISQRAEGRPKFCAHGLTMQLGSPHGILEGGAVVCTRTVCLHTGSWTGQRWHSCTEGMGVPTPHVFSASGPGPVLGSQGRGLHTPSPGSGKPACKCMCIHTRVHRPNGFGFPALLGGGGGRRRGTSCIFPLLSAAMELPVLLERLPNMLIGTPAMIKKKFQIRATMPQSSGRKQLFRNPAGAGFQGCFPLLILKVTASNCCFAHDQSSTNSHQAGPKP